jgi:PAS domain S-box-containing protein
MAFEGVQRGPTGSHAREVGQQGLRAVIRSSFDAIVVVDRDGLVLFANPTAEQLLGRSAAELVGAQFGLPHTRGEAIEIEVGTAPRVAEMRVVEIEWDVRPALLALLRDVASLRLAAIVEQSADAIFAFDHEGVITDWNRGAERLLGYAPPDAIGRPVMMLVPENRSAHESELHGVALAGQSVDYETECVRADGALVEVSMIISPIRATGGEVIAASAIARDVTERNRAEENFRVVLESAPDAIVLVNAGDGEIVLVNAQTEKLFGYAREELLGKRLETLVPDRFRDRHADHRSVYRTDPRTRAMGAGLDLFGRRKDGSEFPVEISLSPLKSDDGTLVSSAIRDITTRKQAEAEHRLVEDELRHSRERLAEAERVARTGSWEWHLADDHITWSDGLFGIHGLTPDEFDPSFDGASKLIYPDDREHVIQTLERAVAERSSFTLEMRAIRSDGRVRTFRSQGEVVVDDTGEPIRVVGIVQDITDAKLAQEALQSTSADLERRANDLQQLALRTATEAPATPHAPLSARQLEILRLIAQGLTNAAIAERLVVTEGTIKFHVRRILAKTNTTNRTAAVVRVLGAPQSEPPHTNQHVP